MATSMRITLFLLCILPLSSCSQRHVDTQTIPDEQFADIFANYLLLKEESSQAHVDSLLFFQKAESLYAVHGVTTERMKKTTEELNRNPDRWREMYAKIVLKLETIQRDRKTKLRVTPP